MPKVLIPRLIHRIWLGSPIPPEFERFADSWARLNPGWEMRLWTEDNLPLLINQQLFDRAPDLVSSRLVPRFRSNLVRYEVLLAHGGLYVDCDFEALKPIDSLIAGLDCFAAEERPGLIANGFMGSVRFHPLLRQLIDDAPASVVKRPGQPSWRTTGPEHLTRVAADRPGELSLVPTAAVYPYHHTDLDVEGKHPTPPADAYAHHVWASRRKSVSVVIPWRPGCPHREAARAAVGERLAVAQPDWQVVDADCLDEEWNKAEAAITGVAASFGDVIVVHDADVWCEALPEAVQAVRNGAAWAMPHSQVYRLSPAATEAVLTKAATLDEARASTVERPYRGVDGGGIVVVSRATFEKVPPDTRFRGWGGEDESWAAALSTLAGPVWRGDAPLIHFWHPPQPRQSRSRGSEENYALHQAYRAARGNRARMLDVMGRGSTSRVVHIYRHERTGRQRMVRKGTPEHITLNADSRWSKVT
jgi:hypothetical protein